MHFKPLCIQSDSAAQVSTVIQPCIIPSHCLSILYMPHCICMWPQPTSTWVKSSKMPHEKNNFGPPFKCFWEKADSTLASDEARPWSQKVDNQTVRCSLSKELLTGLKVDVCIWTSVSAPRRDNLPTIHSTLIYDERVYFEQFCLTKKMCNLCGSLFEILTQNKSIIGVLSWKQSILRILEWILLLSGSASHDWKTTCLFYQEC